jgi:hypothetical protein
MKKHLLLAALIIAAFAPHALADGFTALAPIPGLTDSQAVGSAINPNTLAAFFNNLYKYLIGAAATIAVIEIIWGGLEYSTTDSIGNKEEGKERIRNAIFGLILILSPVLVFSIINPSILNLSLNLPPIDLKTNTSADSNRDAANRQADWPTCGPNVVGSCVNRTPAQQTEYDTRQRQNSDAQRICYDIAGNTTPCTD